MNLLDLLAAVDPSQGGAGGNSAAPPMTPAAAPAPAPMSGVNVAAKRSSGMTPGGASAYDNTPELQAIQQAQQSNPEHSGMFGIHGTLRNLLGTLGDAFLVQSGHSPTYAPQVQREKLGDAMAGFQNNPGVAASRMAETGAPGGAELALKMYDSSQTESLRKAQQEYTDQWRKAQEADRTNQQLTRLTPYAGAMASDPNIKTPEDYASASSRILAMAQRIKPDATLQDIGLPDPADWKPGMLDTMGATQGQVLHNFTSNRSIDERGDAAYQAHQDRIRGQNMNGNRPTTSSIVQSLIEKQNQGIPLSNAEQAYWNAQTQGKSRPKAALNIPGLSNTAPTGGAPKYENNKVYQDARGNKAKYVNGNWIPQ